MSSLRIRRAEAVFAAAVLLAAAALFFVQHAPASGTGSASMKAVIAQDGRVVRTIDLSAVQEPSELRIESGGGFNVVRVEPGRIRIAEADCPDKACVNAGWIDAPGRPIACVPHGLAIAVERADGAVSALDGKEAADGIDAVTR